MNIKTVISCIFIILLPFLAYSESVNADNIIGKVVGIENNEPLAFVSIHLVESVFETRTDAYGEFKINSKNFTLSKSKAKVSCVGYKTEIVSLLGSNGKTTIKLSRQMQNLQEIVVKKQKYKNKKNPAVELIEKVIENKKTTEKRYWIITRMRNTRKFSLQ